MTTATGAKTRPRIRVQELVNRFVKEGLDRPLSEDDPDIYYPDSDGNPMAETDAQFYPLTETVLALRQHYSDRDDVYVSGDLLVYYRMNDNTVRLAPDVFVVFGVEDHLRSSYIIWREGGKAPDFVLEIASPGTFIRDMTEKRALYAALGVTEYWRFDPTGQLFSPALVGEQLAEDGEYEPIEIGTGEDGVLRGYSAVLALEVCRRPDGELRLYDPESQTWLSYLAEEVSARQAAEEARDAAEARARALEEQLRQHGLSPDQA